MNGNEKSNLSLIGLKIMYKKNHKGLYFLDVKCNPIL